MDKAERGKPRRYANESEVDERDRVLMETPMGRDNDQGASDRDSISNNDLRRSDVGARPRSLVTGRHDDGVGANETQDGLDPTGEATRRAAEDIGSGEGVEDRRETPVFDRD